MTNQVLILEDTAARVVEMRKVLEALAPRLRISVFDAAPDFVDALRESLSTTALICLDHDLGPNRTRDGATFDPGIGRDAADVLALYPPVCPVIVHSSNSIAVPGMLRVLKGSGWACSAVMPSDDLRWIATDWRAEVESWIRRGLISP